MVVAVRVMKGGMRDRECGSAAAAADVRGDGVDGVDADEEEEEGRDCCSVLRRSIGVVISLQARRGVQKSGQFRALRPDREELGGSKQRR